MTTFISMMGCQKHHDHNNLRERRSSAPTPKTVHCKNGRVRKSPRIHLPKLRHTPCTARERIHLPEAGSTIGFDLGASGGRNVEDCNIVGETALARRSDEELVLLARTPQCGAARRRASYWPAATWPGSKS